MSLKISERDLELNDMTGLIEFVCNHTKLAMLARKPCIRDSKNISAKINLTCTDD